MQADRADQALAFGADQEARRPYDRHAERGGEAPATKLIREERAVLQLDGVDPISEAMGLPSGSPMGTRPNRRC